MSTSRIELGLRDIFIVEKGTSSGPWQDNSTDGVTASSLPRTTPPGVPLDRPLTSPTYALSWIISRGAEHVSKLGISASYFDQTTCENWCRCSCHKRTRLRTPRLLSSLMGSLFVGYSGLPLVSPTCDQSLYRRRSTKSVLLTYYLPWWFFVQRVAMLLFNFGRLQGPGFSIKMPRIMSASAAVFWFATIGDAENLKRLFTQGLASPNDINSQDGFTPLHVELPKSHLLVGLLTLLDSSYAIQFRQMDVCTLLLQSGSDPNVEDHDKRQVFDGNVSLLMLTIAQDPLSTTPGSKYLVTTSI